jgi:hypothetical protein
MSFWPKIGVTPNCGQPWPRLLLNYLPLFVAVDKAYESIIFTSCDLLYVFIIAVEL